MAETKPTGRRVAQGTDTPPAQPSTSEAKEPAKVTRPPVREGETRRKDERYGAQTCVVNTDHCVGRAVNGVICSYHAMYYTPSGKLREARK